MKLVTPTQAQRILARSNRRGFPRHYTIDNTAGTRPVLPRGILLVRRSSPRQMVQVVVKDAPRLIESRIFSRSKYDPHVGAKQRAKRASAAPAL